MSRKKTLPDHSPGPVDIKAPFSDAFACELKAEFNIPEFFPMAGKLNDAAYWYQSVLVMSPSKVSEQRELLKTLHQQAANLDETLSKLGRDEVKRITAVIPDFSRFSLDETICNVLELKRITQRSLEGVSSKPGRPSEVAINVIVSRLYEVYREATDDNGKITYNAYSDSYTNPSFKFTCKCLPLLDIHMADDAVATVIKRVID